jgi:hypothetical protein
MSAATRIYLVTDTKTGEQQLIRAGNQAQAVRRAAQSKFSVTVASQDDLVTLIAAGHAVIVAGEDQPETEGEQP